MLLSFPPMTWIRDREIVCRPTEMDILPFSAPAVEKAQVGSGQLAVSNSCPAFLLILQHNSIFDIV